MDNNTDLSQQPDTLQQQTPRSFKSLKPFTLIVAVLILFIVATGAYYLGVQSAKPTVSPRADNIQKQAAPTNQQSYWEPIQEPQEESFQDILKKNCKKKKGNEYSYRYINSNKLPISISKTLYINGSLPNKFLCAGDFLGPHNYFFIPLKDIPSNYPSWEGTIDNAVWVYDDKSEEIEHGGFSNLRFYGADIVKEKDMRIIVFLPKRSKLLVNNENPDMPLTMSGQKRLKLSNGQTIYANYSKIAIDGSDSRIVEFLKPYIRQAKGLHDKRTVDVGEILPEDVKKTFFSDISNLQPPEENALLEIKRVLSAITAK